MTLTQTSQNFVAKWRNTALKERSAAQEHFLDLCALVGHPTPAQDDPTGERFTFEAGADRQAGGQGWADVWKRGFFAWEYKGRHADLDKAYQQLLQYRESLQNPPLLVVSDIDWIVVHTNFTNTVKQVIRIGLDDLLTPEGVRQLRAIFYEPEYFRAPQTTEQVTREAAQEFARLSALLRETGEDPQTVAHFLIRLLFCLFAEDIGLLPKALFTRLIEQAKRRPDALTQQFRQFSGAMSAGGWFGVEEICHFNGGLFDSDVVLELGRDGVEILHRVSGLDWSSIEPSILGTLFERSLDPSKRAQLGAHYTSKEDILLIVEPVLMAPLRRRWEEVKVQAQELARRRDETSNRGQRTRLHNELEQLIRGFAEELARIRVLDPACGSGNFLYVSLKQLLDLWKEVSIFAGELGLSMLSPLPGTAPSPEQLFGIEINPYAYELAQATIWIGYIQWLDENGYGVPAEPILKPLHNILNMDAILAYDGEGNPVEPAWPEAEVVIGNPPFLGGGKIRAELGNEYTEAIFHLYGGRLPNFSDLVCYWFERARALVKDGKAWRVGLLATNSIRGGANRRVLERIKETGEIFMAWSDRPWILEGAAVRVSMVGFDDGSEQERSLDGKGVSEINPDLTSTVDLSFARGLVENVGICFMGPSPKAPFDIDHDVAQEMLNTPLNINGRPNSDVVRPVASAVDLVRNSRGKWTIDFGLMDQEEAAQYEMPFAYVQETIFPVRASGRRDDYRGMWWQYARPRPEMREALKGLARFIATPAVAKYRIFVWVDARVLCNQGTLVFARDDEYFFGVLHSKLHELWALRMGTWLGKGNDPRYTPTTTFETFPMPWSPGHEPTDDPRVQAIAQAAKNLVEKRDAWLNPSGASEQELKKRTLTNLYNQRPMWLDLAHSKLDAAVLDAYGWPHDLEDEEILARLLALNLKRTARQAAE